MRLFILQIFMDGSNGFKTRARASFIQLRLTIAMHLGLYAIVDLSNVEAR